MRPDIVTVLDSGGGVAGLPELQAAVPLRSIRRAVGRGDLVRVFPRVYAAGGEDPAATRPRAALRFTGGALSHQTALSCWGVLPAAEEVHVTIGANRRVRAW